MSNATIGYICPFVLAIIGLILSAIVIKINSRRQFAFANKPPQQSLIYHVTIAEHNSDGLHVHHWTSPTPPTRESIILYLMAETSFEFEESFSIDDIATEIPIIEVKPLIHEEFSYTKYRLSANRTMTIAQTLVPSSVVA